MKLENIFEIRFLVPPILTVFFIFLFSPHDFTEFLKENSGIGGIIGTTVIILALGFLISSIIERIVGWRKMRSVYGAEEFPLLDTMFKSWNIKFSKDTVHANELATWIVMDKVDYKYKGGRGSVGDQISKRWHMAMANFSSLVGISIAWIIMAILLWLEPSGITYAWADVSIVISGIFFPIFLYNGKTAYLSVVEIERILVHHLNEQE